MTNQKRVWFNRWFSTGVDFIDKIREGDTENRYIIYVTHHHKSKEFMKRADHFSIEKHMRGKDYIEYCLNYCSENKIDIFIPKFCLYNISEHREEFDKIGVKVLLSTSKNVINLLQDKIAFYNDIERHNIVEIPQYYGIKTFQEFLNAYEKIKTNNKMVCYKPSISEGGLDFRLIYETKEEKKRFKGENLVYYKHACEKFEKRKSNRTIMIMEYLNELEYSIDCLAYKGELLAAIPRKKVGWYRMLEENNHLIKIAKEITKKYNFSYVFNIQVRYCDGVPKLLEINPRMSGGLNVSCKSGVNFPYLALRLLDGEEVNIPKADFSVVEKMEESTAPQKSKMV